MNEESRALPNALELASDLEDDNFRGNTTQIVNIIRALAEEYEISRRDYDVMSRLCIGAQKNLETMKEWMKCDMTGDSDYPTTWDCFSVDHREMSETGYRAEDQKWSEDYNKD